MDFVGHVELSKGRVAILVDVIFDVVHLVFCYGFSEFF